MSQQLETTNTRLRIRVQSLGAGDFPNNNNNNDDNENDNNAVAAGAGADNADANNVFDNNDIHRTAGSSCHDTSKITTTTTKPKPPPPLNRTLTPATTDSSSTITGGSEEGNEVEEKKDNKTQSKETQTLMRTACRESRTEGGMERDGERETLLHCCLLVFLFFNVPVKATVCDPDQICVRIFVQGRA